MKSPIQSRLIFILAVLMLALPCFANERGPIIYLNCSLESMFHSELISEQTHRYSVHIVFTPDKSNKSGSVRLDGYKLNKFSDPETLEFKAGDCKDDKFDQCTAKILIDSSQISVQIREHHLRNFSFIELQSIFIDRFSGDFHWITMIYPDNGETYLAPIETLAAGSCRAAPEAAPAGQPGAKF